mgnify:CR=1 FL=1
MNDQEFIRFLWDHGHFWNTKYPETYAVKESDLLSLTLQHPLVKMAVMSFQEADANLILLSLDHHARMPVFDGEAGPVTRMLATMVRCPLPDHPPPAGASFRYGDPDLQQAVERMQAVTGRGSWPVGCHGTVGVHEVKISYDLSRLTDKHRQWWPEIKRRSAEAVAAIGLRLIDVPVGSSANITVYGRVLGGSVIGMAEFNNQSCGDTVFCQLNPNYAPDIDMVLNLLLHENGHNWNLEHRPGNIMNPSILRTPTYWIKRENGVITYQDNSYPMLKKYFGGEPIDGPSPPLPPLPPLPPTPPPLPPPNEPWWLVLLRALLERVLKGEIDMGAIIALLLPILIKVLPDLLKSLARKDAQAARDGYAGPMTAYFDALERGQTDAEAYEAHCASYLRCRADERKAAGRPAWSHIVA